MKKHKQRASPSRFVEPIKTLEEIEKVKHYLTLKPQELLMFTIGINSPMSVKKLLQLRVCDIKHIKEHHSESIIKIFDFYLSIRALGPSEYLFSKKSNSGKPIKGEYATYLVKKWCADCNIKGNYGAQSLRKTFGYIQRVYYGVDIGVLADMYGHRCPSITLKYLCIDSKDHFSIVSI